MTFNLCASAPSTLKHISPPHPPISAVAIPSTVFFEYNEFNVSSDVLCKSYQFLITSSIPFSALVSGVRFKERESSGEAVCDGVEKVVARVVVRVV